MDKKLQAFADYMAVSIDKIQEIDWGIFKVCSEEYRIFADEEVSEVVGDHIKESLWAFDPSFIASHTKKLSSDHAIKAIEKMQGKLGEDANEIIEELVIDDIEKFIDDAVKAYGRGEFLARCDGCENEHSYMGTTYYIYRTN